MGANGTGGIYSAAYYAEFVGPQPTPGRLTLLPPHLIGGTMVIGIIIICVLIAFLCGRKYERKQFVKIGKPKKTTQDVLGVWDDKSRKN